MLMLTVTLAMSALSQKKNIDGPWVVSKKGKVVLYTRPLGHSKTPSPDSLAIAAILNEQNNGVHYINRQLNTHFRARFSVYLFNRDEAKEKIGTNLGGSSNSLTRTIYFTFSGKPKRDPITGNMEYIGRHELVHIIANNSLGVSYSKMMAEGYANAIDGTFGKERDSTGIVQAVLLETLVKQHTKEDKLLKPAQLVDGYEEHPSSVYYPQVGFFMAWLFNNYGIRQINKAYASNNLNVVANIEKVTQTTFADIEAKYLAYILTLK